MLFNTSIIRQSLHSLIPVLFLLRLMNGCMGVLAGQSVLSDERILMYRNVYLYEEG